MLCILKHRHNGLLDDVWCLKILILAKLKLSFIISLLEYSVTQLLFCKHIFVSFLAKLSKKYALFRWAFNEIARKFELNSHALGGQFNKHFIVFSQLLFICLNTSSRSFIDRLRGDKKFRDILHPRWPKSFKSVNFPLRMFSTVNHFFNLLKHSFRPFLGRLFTVIFRIFTVRILPMSSALAMGMYAWWN